MKILSGNATPQPPDHLDILITGASGFIGRHLAKALLARGDRVVSLSRTAPASGAEHMPVTEYTPRLLKKALAGRCFDLFFHLAGAGSVPEDRNLLTLSRINAVLPGVMVELAAHCRAKAFVFAGSYAEYAAPPKRERLTEEHPLEDGEAYGTSKAAGGEFALLQGEYYDIPVGSARLFNVYGPGDTLPHRLFPSLVERLSRGQEVPLSAGAQTRDFVFVNDVCDAMQRMGDALMRGQLASGAYNVCTGTALTVAQFACETAARLGAPQSLLRFGALPPRPVLDASYRVGNPEKLAHCLGWRARYDLSQGLAACVADLRK